MNLLNGSAAAIRFRKAGILKELKDKFNIVPRLGRYEFPIKPDPQDNAKPNPYEPLTIQKRGRCVVFKAEDFLSEDEMKNEFSEFFGIENIQKHRELERLANTGLDEEIF